MKFAIKLCLLITVISGPSAQIVGEDFSPEAPVQSCVITNVYAAAVSRASCPRLPPITDVYATAYYCVYDSEIDGVQTVTKIISNETYTLKTSFLFGGLGVAMQGTGKTELLGCYIKYTGGAGCFVRISGPDAGKNLAGRYVVNPQTLRNRYEMLGVTDFTGFGNLALLHPGRATYQCVSSVTGSTGQTLTPWQSAAADPELILIGKSFSICFKSSSLSPLHCRGFTANDTGPAVKGKRIDIYLGEGQAALDQWLHSGGNRLVDIYFP